MKCKESLRPQPWLGSTWLRGPCLSRMKDTNFCKGCVWHYANLCRPDKRHMRPGSILPATSSGSSSSMSMTSSSSTALKSLKRYLGGLDSHRDTTRTMYLIGTSNKFTESELPTLHDPVTGWTPSKKQKKVGTKKPNQLTLLNVTYRQCSTQDPLKNRSFQPLLIAIKRKLNFNRIKFINTKKSRD